MEIVNLLSKAVRLVSLSGEEQVLPRYEGQPPYANSARPDGGRKARTGVNIRRNLVFLRDNFPEETADTLYIVPVRVRDAAPQRRDLVSIEKSAQGVGEIRAEKLYGPPRLR